MKEKKESNMLRELSLIGSEHMCHENVDGDKFPSCS